MFSVQSLEIAKARLRSRTTYSPVEKLLQRALENYKNELEILNKKLPTEQTYNKKTQELSGQATAEKDDSQEEARLYDLIMHNVLEASNKSNQANVESRRNWQFLHSIFSIFISFVFVEFYAMYFC